MIACIILLSEVNLRNRSKPTSVGNILGSLTRNVKCAEKAGLEKLGKQLEQAAIWDNWPEIAGVYLAKHGRPSGIKDNRLHIEVDSAVWMHKYSYKKWDIIKRINRLARKELVSDIFVELASEDDE